MSQVKAKAGRGGALAETWFAIAIFAIIWIMDLIPVVRGFDLNQLELKTFYAGTRAFFAGRDPYAVAPPEVVFPFAYPPLMLWIFAPLGVFPYAWAYYLYLLAKLVAFAGMLTLWRRALFPQTRTFLFLAALLCFTFSEGFYFDFVSGNVSVFEQLLVWTGVTLLLRDRILASAVSMAFVTMLKVLPGSFSLIYLLRKAKSGLVWMVAIMAVVTGIVFVLSPGPTRTFASFSPYLMGADRGLYNESLLALIQDVVVERLRIALAPYLIVVAVMASLTLVLVRRALQVGEERPALFLMLATIPMLWPRMRNNYSPYFLPSAYYLFESARTRFGGLVGGGVFLAFSLTTVPVTPLSRLVALALGTPVGIGAPGLTGLGILHEYHLFFSFSLLWVGLAAWAAYSVRWRTVVATQMATDSGGD